MKSIDTRLVNKFLYPVNYLYFKENGLPRPFNYLMVTSLIEDKDVPGNLIDILRKQDDEYEYWRFYGDGRDNWLNYGVIY